MSKKTLTRLLPIVTFILGMFVVSLTGAAQTAEKADPKGGTAGLVTANAVIVDNHNGNFSVPFVFFQDSGNGTDQLVDFTVDLNYDGLTDIAANGTYVSNGDGSWTRTSTNNATAMSQYERLADINGDGILDTFRLSPWSSNILQARVGLGATNDPNESAKWNMDIAANTLTSGDRLARSYNLVDVNGDSLADLIIAYQGGAEIYKKMYLNNGHGWDLVVDYYTR